jgi:hypothetical protein
MKSYDVVSISMRINIFVKMLIISGLIILTTVPLSFVFASSSNNWTEVARFTGGGSDSSTTDYFTCDHVEWRIRWEYVPRSDYPDYSVFGVITYEHGIEYIYVDMVNQMGSENTEGVSYIHNNEGTFYMEFSIANTESFTVIIEQDTSSIPEFPTWMTTPLLVVAALAAIVCKRKLDKNKSQC